VVAATNTSYDHNHPDYYTTSSHRGCIIKVPGPCGFPGSKQSKAHYPGAYNGSTGSAISASSSLPQELEKQGARIGQGGVNFVLQHEGQSGVSKGFLYVQLQAIPLGVIFALVESENGESWRWFLRLLKSALPESGKSSSTLMSDRDNGLQSPDSELQHV